MADVQHKNIPDAQRHEPKGISTATSNQVYVSDGLGSGSWTDRASGASSTVIVNAVDDFPTPSGGSITLAPNTTYVLGSDVTTSDNFIVSNGSKITGNNWLSPLLTYTGTGSMFSGTDVSFLSADVRLSCPSAKVFNFVDTVGGVHSFEANSTIVESCASYGSFSDMLFVGIINSSSGDADSGLSFSGSNFGLVSLRQFALTSTSGTFVGVDFGTSVMTTLEVRDIFLVGPAGGIGLKGQTNNANIAAGFRATVSSGTFVGGLTPLSGITVDDFRWIFMGNNGIQNTKADAMVSLSNNATATTITTSGTPVKAAGTFVVERESHFTGSTDGRVTYNGEVDIVVPVDISVTLDPAAGTNQDLRTYLAVNGTVIPNSGKTIRADAGVPEGVTLPWQLELTTSDYLEIFVENNTSTNNVIVEDAVLRVR